MCQKFQWQDVPILSILLCIFPIAGRLDNLRKARLTCVLLNHQPQGILDVLISRRRRPLSQPVGQPRPHVLHFLLVAALGDLETGFPQPRLTYMHSTLTVLRGQGVGSSLTLQLRDMAGNPQLT